MKATALLTRVQYAHDVVNAITILYTSQRKNLAKCANCGGNHVSRSDDRETWKEEIVIMKIKVTQRSTYPEARKVYDQQTPQFTFSEVYHQCRRNPKQKPLHHNTVKKFRNDRKLPSYHCTLTKTESKQSKFNK